jgi:peptidoglycan/xylan/chitin deacetylase (PgdA/CDA1 family)
MSGFFYFLRLLITYKPLAYHNVIPDEFYDDSLHLGVSHASSVFEKQIKVLSTFFGKKNIVFTFDDGYLNNHLIVMPILNRFNIKGLFFVPLVKDEKSEPFWVDKIMYLLSYCKPGLYSFGEISFQLTDSNRRHNFSLLYDYILNNYSQKNKIIAITDDYLKYCNFINNKYYELRFSFMDCNAISEMKDSGHEIGFHSVNHDIYSKLSKEDILEELTLCKPKLNFFKVKSFAFPFGGDLEINLRFIKILKQFNIINVYSNVNKRDNPIISRFSLPNTPNKYLIIFHYIKNVLFL